MSSSGSCRKKLKTGEGNSGDGSVVPTPLCVIHFPDSKCDQFTPLTQPRLDKLNDIKQKRLNQPLKSSYRLSQICVQIPESLSPEYGYHRDCYQRFTSKLDRLKEPENVSDQPGTSGTSHLLRRSRSDADTIIFTKDCIFCEKTGRKKIKKGSIWTTEDTTTFDYEGGETVQRVAEVNQCERLLVRIRGYNLFSCEAHYHPRCRREFTHDPNHWRSADESNKLEQYNMEMSHTEAYKQVCQLVDAKLIETKGIIKLSDLVDKYIDALHDTSHPNPFYRTEKLKNKLQKSYPQSLSFVALPKKGQFRSMLVYSSDIDVDALIHMTYDLSNSDKVKEVALSLRNDIFSAYAASEALPWPPTAHQLEESVEVLPGSIAKFLGILFIGSNVDGSTRVNRLIQSIGQDLCRATTSGQWKMPKHILLCMTLRHLFRSAELITLINRFGHCDNYSFSLELETALAEAADRSSTLLTNQIVRNPQGRTVFHSEFDNFDQNTASGSIHTAHGIMLQEVDDSQKITLPVPEVKKTKQRSLQLQADADELPDCYVSVRKSPPYNIARWTYPEGRIYMDYIKT